MDLWRVIADHGDLQAGVPGTAVGCDAAHAYIAARGQTQPPLAVDWAGGKSVADAASSKTRPREIPRMRAASAAVAACGSAKKVNGLHTPFVSSGSRSMIYGHKRGW
jgi:hypothetical protein